MRKQEFIDKLRIALNGRVSPSLVMENVRFYEDYINTEIQKGSAEEEVLASLGDPRLIARTIIDTNTAGDAEEADYRETPYEQQSGDRRQRIHSMGRLPGWVWVVIGVLVLGVIVSAVFSVLSVLLPFLLPVALILLMIKVFRDWLK